MVVEIPSNLLERLEFDLPQRIQCQSGSVLENWKVVVVAAAAVFRLSWRRMAVAADSTKYIPTDQDNIPAVPAIEGVCALIGPFQRQIVDI